MDYVVGSVAALITGNVTPNRPRLTKRALTPTKHQPSPNVTPKSEMVDDRSIFLSPSVQKKKAIVKKSPKRIFQNPDLETTENEGNLSTSSPKAEKVKKHLKDDLESESVANKNVAKPKSPKNKANNKKDSVSPQDSSVNISEKDANEHTPTKKKKKRQSESSNIESVASELQFVTAPENITMSPKSPKKMMKRRKSVVDTDSNKENDNMDTPEAPVTPVESKSPKKQKTDSNTIANTEVNENNKSKKKNKKKKKKKPKSNSNETENDKEESKSEEKADIQQENQVSPKNKNRKRKKSNSESNKSESKNVDDEKSSEEEDDDTNNSKRSKTRVNPNAITDKESDSEHESDDEIESENEEINKKVLDAGPPDESSDEDNDEPQKKVEKKPEKKEPSKEKTAERNTEDEIKRTLFVGNVPFSNKCKKDIKKIFNKYGQIETIRIRTVPVKDGRYTPKLAVIKNELHPERTTVNVYVKFADVESVEKALMENNTTLNEHHLRVTRSNTTGSEHDPRAAIFVGNLPFAMEDDALRAKFENCGPISSVRIIRDKKTSAGKGFGYVNFESKDAVELALALTEEDLTVKNRILRVKRCTQVTNRQKQNNQNASRPPPAHKLQQNRGNKQFGRSQENERETGAYRRLMHKRKNQDGASEGPPNKRQKNINQPGREKKSRKEFVGMTAEKKKKHKFNKGQKKKKALSEILTK